MIMNKKQCVNCDSKRTNCTEDVRWHIEDTNLSETNLKYSSATKKKNICQFVSGGKISLSSAVNGHFHISPSSVCIHTGHAALSGSKYYFNSSLATLFIDYKILVGLPRVS